MTTMTPQRLAEIGERVEKATKGPWRWNLNVKSKWVSLEGVTGMLETIMRPIRWGMSGARFEFIKNGLMTPCEDFQKPHPNREHHAHWCADIDHPDAQFIAHSRTDIPDLLAEIDRLKQVERLTLTIDQIKDLAEFAGLKVEGEITEDDKETEIVITKCPEQGVKDDDDDGTIVHYRHIACLEEYPEEGVCGLGEQLKTLLEKGQQ